MQYDRRSTGAFRRSRYGGRTGPGGGRGETGHYRSDDDCIAIVTGPVETPHAVPVVPRYIHVIAGRRRGVFYWGLGKAELCRDDEHGQPIGCPCSPEKTSRIPSHSRHVGAEQEAPRADAYAFFLFCRSISFWIIRSLMLPEKTKTPMKWKNIPIPHPRSGQINQ